MAWIDNGDGSFSKTLADQSILTSTGTSGRQRDKDHVHTNIPNNAEGFGGGYSFTVDDKNAGGSDDMVNIAVGVVGGLASIASDVLSGLGSIVTGSDD